MIPNRLKKIGGERILTPLRRRRLKNRNFTLIANNCCGGLIYHNLHEKFLSPTINLFFVASDYLCFLENLDEAVGSPVHQISADRTGMKPEYPLGEIRLNNGRTIQIHFMHYPDFETAVEKWNSRCKRINKNNMFVLMELGCETCEEYAKRFDALPFSNKAMITAKPFPEIRSSVHINIYDDNYTPGKILLFMPGSLRKYIDLFDYVGWLNTGRVQRAAFYDKYL